MIIHETRVAYAKTMFSNDESLGSRVTWERTEGLGDRIEAAAPVTEVLWILVTTYDEWNAQCLLEGNQR